MRVLPRVTGAAAFVAALLLLATPLSATLPSGTTWSLPGFTRITTASASASRTQRSFDTVHLGLDAGVGFSLYLESEPGMVYTGVLVEDGRRTLLVVDQASRDAYRAAIVVGLEAMGVAVVESSEPLWSLPARMKPRQGVDEIRLTLSMRWRITAEYAGRTKRIALRMTGRYRGPGDA